MAATKYRRREPEVVEAMQYAAETCEAFCAWLWGEQHPHDGDCGAPIFGTRMDDGGDDVDIDPGDWVLRHDRGTHVEHEKLTDDEFRALYEPLGEEEME